MNRVHLICHPASGGGKGQKVWQEVSDILSDFQMNVVSYFTDTNNTAELIIQQIMNRNHTPPLNQLIVIGGDGTLHEVVTALMLMGERPPITYIAAGGGNDFHRVWSPGASPREMIEHMIYAREPIEVPVIHERNRIDGSESVFVNNHGFGFDAAVNYNRHKLSANPSINRYVSGSLQYRIALALTLPEIPHFQVSLKMDESVYHFDNASLLTVMNHAYLGGGLLIDNTVNPAAKEIALVVYHDITFRSVRDIIPRVLHSHTHDESPYITQLKGQNLHLTIHDPVRGQVDGEPLVKLPYEYEFNVASYPFYLPGK